MIRFIFLMLAFLISILPLLVSAQDTNDWQSNKWRDFTLDQTTAEEAIQVLGKPSKERVDKLPVRDVGYWLSEKQKEKVFRVLVWAKNESRQEVTMSFLGEKLVLLRLGNRLNLGNDNLDLFSPDDLNSIFGEKFTSFDSDKLPPLPEFQKFPGETREKVVKDAYLMIAVAQKSFITAYVDDMRESESGVGIFGRYRDSAAKERNKERRTENDAQRFPGRVRIIQLVSRKLEL